MQRMSSVFVIDGVNYSVPDVDEYHVPVNVPFSCTLFMITKTLVNECRSSGSVTEVISRRFSMQFIVLISPSIFVTSSSRSLF